MAAGCVRGRGKLAKKRHGNKSSMPIVKPQKSKSASPISSICRVYPDLHMPAGEWKRRRAAVRRSAQAMIRVTFAPDFLPDSPRSGQHLAHRGCAGRESWPAHGLSCGRQPPESSHAPWETWRIIKSKPCITGSLGNRSAHGCRCTGKAHLIRLSAGGGNVHWPLGLSPLGPRLLSSILRQLAVVCHADTFSIQRPPLRRFPASSSAPPRLSSLFHSLYKSIHHHVATAGHCRWCWL